MEFETKRSLLEYLGKNWNDNKLVDRMIIRWEVIKRDGMYVLVKGGDVDILKKEIAELREKIEWYKVENNKMNNIVAEMEESLEKWWDNTDIVNKVYKYLTQVLHLRIDKSDFIEWLDNN